MAEKGREDRQFPLDIFARAIPVGQGLDGEMVTKIVNPRTIALPPLPQADLSRQLPEHPVHVLVQQSATLLGDKEIGATRRDEMRVASRGIVRQHGDRRGMERDQPRLAELRLSNGEDTLVQIDVVPAQVERFGMA